VKKGENRRKKEKRAEGFFPLSVKKGGGSSYAAAQKVALEKQNVVE